MDKEIKELLEQLAKKNIEGENYCGVCRKPIWVCNCNGTCLGIKVRTILERLNETA